MARITVVTAGHLSTCPRMVKAADALAGAGHQVRVVSTASVTWASAADEAMRRVRHWPWTRLDHAPGTWAGLTRAVRSRVATVAVDLRGAERVPWGVAVRAYAPMHPALVRAAAAAPADLIYGGTTGALAAVAEAASRVGCPYALDLEDLHTAESVEPDAARQHALAARVEARVLPGAAFLTTSSAAIGDAYRARYGLDAAVVHNVVERPPAARPAEREAGGPLRLYWVGQAIGSDRGVEEVIDAVGVAGIPAVLTLRGRATAFVEALRARAASRAPGLTVMVVSPLGPDALVDDAREHDVGVAGEPLPIESRRRCLSNKIFTYLASGLAVVACQTPGLAPLADDLAAAGVVYRPGDVGAIAARLRRWHDDRASLHAARAAAHAAAVRRWHWEHADERGRLLALVAGVVG